VGNDIFVCSYTMDQLNAEGRLIDHDKMKRRYLALLRLARIKNNLVINS